MTAGKADRAARFDQRDLVHDQGGAFSVTLPPDRADTTLVIDIYDLDNPVHPDGHIGWWQFEAEQLPQQLAATLARNADQTVSLSVADIAPVAQWLNPDRIGAARLELIAAMRSTITHAILSIDKIPVMLTLDELHRLRRQSERKFLKVRYATRELDLSPGQAVHVVSQSMFERDAVGNLCFALYGMLKQHGATVRLYADAFDVAMNDIVERRHALPTAVAPDDVVFLFFSIYDESLEELMALPCCRRIVYYHGVTSPQLLQVFDTETSMQCAKALRQVPLLARFDRLATNSEANATALRSAGRVSLTEAIAVIPPKILAEGDLQLSEKRDERADPASPKFLYVGRLKSHKRIEDLLHLISHYRALDPNATCTIVGAPASSAYRDYLEWIQECELELPKEAVVWLGHVSDCELERAYREATVYVSMSEDEGFCIPILEAMTHDLLVYAYDLPAVRELMDGTGTLFSAKKFPELARQIQGLLRSPTARETVVTAQHRRAQDLIRTMDGGKFFDLIAGRT
jgi:glycosyltransferase involved in cell wall biosynthesis